MAAPGGELRFVKETIADLECTDDLVVDAGRPGVAVAREEPADPEGG